MAPGKKRSRPLHAGLNLIIALFDIRNAISRRRSFIVAPLYERRNPPVADRRYSFGPSPTYGAYIETIQLEYAGPWSYGAGQFF